MMPSAWPTDDAAVATWGRGLVQLVNRHLPKEVRGLQGTTIEQWSLVGPAYVVKASGTLDTMLMLFDKRRTADATLLLRSLFENMLVFSWIAIEPTTNLSRWIKKVCDQAIKSDNDWRGIGMPLLDTANRAYAECKVNDGAVKSAPDNLQMAKEVDDHWKRTYPGHPEITGQDRDFLTFRGLYRHVYRLGSQAAHQDPRSLHAFHTSDVTGFTSVHVERPDQYYLYPWLFGGHVVTLGLAIASAVVGWPAASDVWGVRDTALGGSGT